MSSQNTSNQSNNAKASPSVTPAVPASHPDASSIKNSQRRKKTPGHRRTNSKGSVASWTPPSLTTIASQEGKRASIHATPDITDPTNENLPSFSSIASPIPSISADVDSKRNNRQLNPKALKLDLVNASSPATTFERPTTLFTYVQRKSSSSDPEEHDPDHASSLARQRRRRPFNVNNNRIGSPSSLTSRSAKGNIPDPSTPQAEETTARVDNQNDPDKSNEGRKYSRTVSFHPSPSILNDRSPSYPPRKVANRVRRGRLEVIECISSVCLLASSIQFFGGR